MRLASLVAAALLQGCIFVPQSTTQYDEQCDLHTRVMTLRPEMVGHLGSCSGRDCGYLLAALGIVAAGSLVVSGSVVIIGNVVSWAEKEGKCRALAMLR